ncbi:MAG: hypothetical protein N5P05_000545 [Chroococcopsis gigantea SAG 12.99]|jgi:hypothetical protein|nr:hypothetical protein [Chroococcopsis gigantea SAG 12.99]
MGLFAVKPDFDNTSEAELKAYILAHKEDEPLTEIN